MNIKIPVIICCLLIAGNLYAQQSKTGNKWTVGVQAAGGLSYTGYNVFVLPSISHSRHTIYFGPKLSVTSSYFPYSNSWGLNVGYRVRLVGNAHWDAGLGVDYQCSFYRPYNPYQLHLMHNYNKIHEAFLAAGIRYKPVRNGRLMFDLVLGSGGFLESFDDVAEGQTHMNTGRASLLQIDVGYKIL